MKSVNNPVLVVISFWWIIPSLSLYMYYGLYKDYVTQTMFNVGLGIFIIGLIGFLITFLLGIFPLKEEDFVLNTEGVKDED